MSANSKPRLRKSLLAASILVCALIHAGCKQGTPAFELDHPRISAPVQKIDTVVHSSALQTTLPIRIILPLGSAASGHAFPVVYFLHGAGQNLYDWTNHSQIADFAAQGFILVFVDAPGSYYIDDARSARNRYEQYIVNDVPAAVHQAVPAATNDPRLTALVGISRGGYGAVVLGLKHADKYSFIGDVSGALDLNKRRFRWSSPFASQDVARAFGPSGSPTRSQNDPETLLLSRRASPPYFFVACGQQDSLLAQNRAFAAHLSAMGLPMEAHFAPGAHNWDFWSGQIPALEAALKVNLRK